MKVRTVVLTLGVTTMLLSLSWAQGGVSDADAVAALGPRPGCWQVRIHSSIDPGPPAASQSDTALAQCQRDVLARLTPAVRAKMSPEEIKYYENSCANLVQMAVKAQQDTFDFMKKGGDTGPALSCGLEGFSRMAQDVYGEFDPSRHCVRKIEEIAGQRHMHVSCNNLEADYVRIDAEHFTGVRREINTAKGPGSANSISAQFTSKWVAEAQAHMPYSPPNTNLDGVRARGPAAVQGLDPYRIVAAMDGRKIIAGWAQFFLRNANAAAQDEPKTLPNRLQDEYLRFIVAYRAHQLHLDLLPRWKDGLTGYPTWWYTALDVDADPGLFMRPLPQFPATSRVLLPPAEQAFINAHPDFGYATPEQINQVEKILWQAYFDRFPTQAEKQRELLGLKQKYKMTIVDQDFFEQDRP